MSVLDNTNDIRRRLRRQRAELSASAQSYAAKMVAKHIRAAHLLRCGDRVGIYHAFRGEVNLRSVIENARRMKCALYEPRIMLWRAGRMRFMALPDETVLRSAPFRIREPHRPQAYVSPLRLDLVFVPLVAFDARGTRLGMGAGFYDRAFSHLARDRRWRRPKLIGIAHAFQRVDRIERRSWDVALDAVVTEAGLHWFNDLR